MYSCPYCGQWCHHYDGFQSMLRKNEKKLFWKEWLHLLSQAGVMSSEWFYYPGLAGEHGDEVADKLAGQETINERLTMDTMVIVKAVSERLRENEKQKWKNIEFLKRLLELRQIKSSCREFKLRARKWIVNNNHVMRTTSKQTLGWMRRSIYRLSRMKMESEFWTLNLHDPCEPYQARDNVLHLRVYNFCCGSSAICWILFF